MHKLLKRQLKKLPQNTDIPKSFLDAIEAAYHEFDEDLKRSERILDQSLKELFQSNESLKAFAASKEQEASDLSNQLSDIINTITEVVFQVSKEGKWLYLNPAFDTILGYSANSAINNFVKDYVHPEDRFILEKNSQDLLTGKTKTCEAIMRFKTKTGGYKWLQVRSRVKDANTANTRITGTISDVDYSYRVQKENNQLALVAKKTRNIIVITDKYGCITYVNEAFINLTEYSLDEVLGKVPGHLLQGKETNKSTVEHIRTCLEEKKSFNGEILNYSKSGKKYWLRMAIDPLTSESGEHIGFIAVENEITEEKQKALEVLKTNGQLNSLLENLNSGVLVEDENKRIVLTNQLFLDYFKIPGKPEELVGIDCSESAHQFAPLMKDPAHFLTRINQILDNKEKVLEEEIEFADGAIMERDYIPIIINQMYYGHLWQYRDITERINHQHQIEVSELKYRTLLESLNLGLLEVDLTGRIKTAFPGFCHLTGYNQEELEGEYAAELLLDANGKKITSEQLNNRKKGATNVYEQKLIKKNGDEVWVLISATPVYDSKQNVVGSIGVHMDVSIQKENEERLKSYAAELESINKELDQFAYIVSHDLKAPLRAINNLTVWIEEDLEGKLDGDIKDNFELLRGRVSRMENLINGILDYSRAGRLTYEKEKVKIDEVLKEITDSLFSNTNAKLIINSALPEFYTERIALIQVLSNLISNAVKYNDKEEPIITVEVKERSDKYEFSVSDNGPGISSDYHEKVFQIFQTLQARDQYESTGVGLSIVKKILDEKNCNINLESELGKGTKFTFEWPK